MCLLSNNIMLYVLILECQECGIFKTIEIIFPCTIKGISVVTNFEGGKYGIKNRYS
jgi:hypothetical protein